jgi:hypothetical protein
MRNGQYDHGYGSLWQDVLVYRREGFTTSVADYHEHEYYELNLILSGNVRILLPGQSVETDDLHDSFLMEKNELDLDDESDDLGYEEESVYEANESYDEE